MSSLGREEGGRTLPEHFPVQKEGVRRGFSGLRTSSGVDWMDGGAVKLPPRRQKLHYTFDNNSLEEIGKTNFSLLSKLNAIATRAPVFGQQGQMVSRSPPKHFKPRCATERERRAAQIDRDNLILLRKIQTTKPEVKKFINTTGRGAGVSVTQRWGLEGAQASPRREKPKWVDPTSTEFPAPRGRMGGGGGGGGAGEGGGGGGRAGGRTRMFRDPENVALVPLPLFRHSPSYPVMALLLY